MFVESDAEVNTESDHGGSGLHAERTRRLARIDDLRNRGIAAYPYRFDRSHALAEIRETWGSLEAGTETEEAVSVAGRLMLKRDSGKLMFAVLRDRTGDLQLFISKAVIGESGFDDAKALDLGDVIGVAGTMMTTRNGELSIKVTELTLLAKSIHPLPDKWHGLTDIDTRFRQRYTDLIVNESARRTFEIRHRTISSFRRTLDAKGFIEVETPVLHNEAGGATARPFITHHNALDLQLYLRIALELHLKRLIVGGMERVYEIGRIFRNEGISPRHNPEFTMMELYQAYGDMSDMMSITEELIVQAARDSIGTTVVEIGGEPVDLAEPWQRGSMVELTSAALGVEVHPAQPIEKLRALAADNGIEVDLAWGTGKLTEELFESSVESTLRGPIFITGHPVEISPLARVDRNDPLLTERFELFIDRREIANGYSELNDPVEQRQRFEAEQEARDAGDAARGTVDEDYLRALEYAMPPTGGLGIGMDRLAMLLAGVDSIKEVILFPTLRPEVFES
jgi:lysyl-tRNA synthetase class 2